MYMVGVTTHLRPPRAELQVSPSARDANDCKENLCNLLACCSLFNILKSGTGYSDWHYFPTPQEESSKQGLHLNGTE